MHHYIHRHHRHVILALLNGLAIISVISSAADYPTENTAVSCGSSGNKTAHDGRLWVGDNTFSLTGKSWSCRAQHKATVLIDPVPYQTARASHRQFTYQFSVRPGPNFVRFHFNPSPYKGYEKSVAFFTVKAGPYTLLRGFNPSLAAADSLVVSKEFCVNVQESQPLLTITFMPSSPISYAFINGIQIVSMQTGLYFTPEGSHVVGQKHRFYIDTTTAMEMVVRLNVGGHSVSSGHDKDVTMFQDWEDDYGYLLSPGRGVRGIGASIETAMRIKHSETHNVVAPLMIYRTARKMNAHRNDDLTWRIRADLGFRYLIRLHFCEFDPEISASGERQFKILINNQVAEDNADVVKWSGGRGVPVFKDYIAVGVGVEGSGNLFISLQHNLDELCCKQREGILSGLEIFKLSNPDNSLAATSQSSLLSKQIPGRNHQRRQVISSFDRKNGIASAFTIAIIMLNIIVYSIRRHLSEANSAMRCRAADADQTARQFSLEEIQLTTNSFSHEFLIGAGGYGKVYRGCIDEGATVVAIKRLKEGSRQGDKEFQTEIKMLSEARNEHLVSLIGFCNEGNERVLIYEYMPRGTLEDHLHHISTGNMPLSWEMRLKISIGAAQGLHYLHTFNHHNAIIHRDVKSSNILLDGDWVAKISDFGLSKMGHRDEPFAHVSTDVKGTFGYFDPEYFLTRRLTTKSDVYSFGVVLLEVLTGRAALDKRLVMEQKSLATWSAGYMRKGNVHEIVETSLAGQVSRACLEEFVDIVQRCLRTQPHRRPDMAHVVSRLELALALQQNEAAEKMVMSTDSDGAFSSDDLSGPFSEESSIGKGKDMIHMEKKRISSTKRSAPAPWRGFLKRFTVTKPSSSAQPSKIKAAPSTLPSKIKVAPSTLPSKIKADPSSTSQFEGLFHFSHKDIKHATENFSESSVIGFVDTDKVYIGYLNGGWIAIRRAISEPSSIQMACKLQLKLHNLQLPSHPNVVSLIGYCDLPDKRSLMLVYNYMEKGSSLYDHLHDNPKDPLPWKQMLKICIDAGHGLNYLQPILKQSMLHCNFNSTNILLDENWAAKVSEICWSRRTDCIDPSEGAYQQSVYVHEPALEKSYVFAFGGLLIEILSANCEMHWKIQEWVSFAEWFGSYSRCTDKNIYGIMSPECHSMFMDMAKSCLQEESRKRPTMGEIIAGLEAALCLQEKMEDEAAMSIDSDGAISLDDLCEPSQES